jgi:hypothetical protein
MTVSRMALHERNAQNLLLSPRRNPRPRRGPVTAKLHVAQMLEQHRQVTQRLESIELLRLRWMETADEEVGRELAERYEDLKAVLNVHLRREVTEVMPVVDRVLTDREGNTGGREARDRSAQQEVPGGLPRDGVVHESAPRPEGNVQGDPRPGPPWLPPHRPQDVSETVRNALPRAPDTQNAVKPRW